MRNNDLNNNQHGFRKGRSCESALTSFIGKVEHSFIDKKKGFSMAVFLDIRGAYDNLSNGAIVRALRKRKCNMKFINWTLDFLKFRKLQVDLKGCSVQRFPRKGVPQGGVGRDACRTTDGTFQGSHSD